MTAPHAHRQGRSGVLLAALAAAAAMLFTFSGCADDSPATDTPGTGSQVGGGGSDVGDLTGGDGGGAGNTVLPRNTSPGATDAPNANAGGGGAGTATSAP